MGRGARSERHRAIGADRERSGRRRIRGGRRQGLPGTIHSLLHAQPEGRPTLYERTKRAFGARASRLCLFPAMHHFHLWEKDLRPILEVVAEHGGVAFVHCGILKSGVRDKLGLPSPFDIRFANLWMLLEWRGPRNILLRAPALRLRLLSRAPAGRERMCERPRRHVQLELLDREAPGADEPRAGFRAGAIGARPGAPLVRIRLELLSARLPRRINSAGRKVSRLLWGWSRRPKRRRSSAET